MKNKGITLISLIITIIILLIVAGISISALTQTGLFEKANQAKQKSENAQALENTTLADYENSINEIVTAGSRENNNNESQYSLEEKEIGTWIDGKPLYRKVIILSEDIASYSFICLEDSLKMGHVHMLFINPYRDSLYQSGIYTTGSTDTCTPYLALSSSTTSLSSPFLTADGYLWIVNCGTCVLKKGSTICIEYTKTADSPIAN